MMYRTTPLIALALLLGLTAGAARAQHANRPKNPLRLMIGAGSTDAPKVKRVTQNDFVSVTTPDYRGLMYKGLVEYDVYHNNARTPIFIGLYADYMNSPFTLKINDFNGGAAGEQDGNVGYIAGGAAVRVYTRGLRTSGENAYIEIGLGLYKARSKTFIATSETSDAVEVRDNKSRLGVRLGFGWEFGKFIMDINANYAGSTSDDLTGALNNFGLMVGFKI